MLSFFLVWCGSFFGSGSVWGAPTSTIIELSPFSEDDTWFIISAAFLINATFRFFRRANPRRFTYIIIGLDLFLIASSLDLLLEIFPVYFPLLYDWYHSIKKHRSSETSAEV